LSRSCGSCTLCCKLLPVVAGHDEGLWNLVPRLVEMGMLTPHQAHHSMKDFDKPAGQRCPHQRHGKGCAVYESRPLACRFWSCAWLGGDGTGTLGRPDRSHYVINPVPDYVDGEQDGHKFKIPVIEVWVDPDYPDAHRDPLLREWLDRRGKQHGFCALIRFSATEGIFLAPPSMTNDHQWHEKPGHAEGLTHTIEQKVAALGDFTITLEEQ
jgi:hypothetical protein